ncbi:MAG: hypothetical protein LBV34_10235, partial [Nocardiopsaceae bacterium]|nr:hypothetical protein [Nocardiopsaceae bacterium]
MSEIARRRWYRWFWPRKVRTKLTLIYACLFLVGGVLLLGLTYGLVAASLPTHASVGGKPPMTVAQYIKLCKRPYSFTHKPGVSKKSQAHNPAMSEKVKHQCRQESAYRAGSAAEATKQRDRALHSLLLYSGLGLGIMTILSAGAGWVIAG